MPATATTSGWSGADPLEPLLLASLAVALVTMTLWFFVVADNPLLW